MNLFVSIFGGMLLTVIVFGVMRVVKLSNFWAAVVAAGLPSFAYMAYSAANWPGLDVLTMHVVAYPTVALLLFQIGGAKDGPYEKVHWAPKLIIGFFVIITMILGGFVYIAGKGVPPSVAQWLLPNIAGKTVHTGFAGVVAHGGEASKSIAHHRNMESKLDKLGWRVEVIGLDALRTGYPGDVRVVVSNRQGQSVSAVQVSIGLGRPGQPVQSRFPLLPANDGSYQTRILLPASGEWLTVLTLESGSERIVFDRVLGRE
ncbi:MAG: FixH family protein [Pseudomonadota bacterium]|nr:FixH family protein [Pseudomonadota bacterium]